MKKLLALVLSMLMVASCFALIAVAEEETTAAEETTVADETTAAEETTEAEPSYSNTLLVFGSNMKVLTSLNGIHKTMVTNFCSKRNFFSLHNFRSNSS